jgi:DNA-binding NarL/FixJ family response regulator
MLIHTHDQVSRRQDGATRQTTNLAHAHPAARAGAADGATILLADNRDAVLAAMRRALEHHGFRVLGCARDSAELVALALQHQPQICLVEVDLPGDGIDAVREIRFELPRTRIAMLTASVAEGDVIRALRAGADGYLLKNVAPDRLVAALAALTRGEIVLPRALTGALVAELRKDPGAVSSRRRRRRGPVLRTRRFLTRYLVRRRAGMAVPVALRSARARPPAGRGD